MKLSNWFRKKKANNSRRVSDSTKLSGVTLGDSEKSRFTSVWTDSAVLSILKQKKLKRL